MASRTALVAREGEGYIADAAACLAQRKQPFELRHRLQEADRIFVVFLDARADREHVGVEQDVFRRDAGLLCEDAMGAPADCDFAFARDRLSFFVESHDDQGRRHSSSQAAPGA